MGQATQGGIPAAVNNPMQTSQFAPPQAFAPVPQTQVPQAQTPPNFANTTIPQWVPGAGGLATQMMNPQLLSLLTNPNMTQMLAALGMAPGQMGNFVGNMGPNQIPGLPSNLTQFAGGALPGVNFNV